MLNLCKSDGMALEIPTIQYICMLRCRDEIGMVVLELLEDGFLQKLHKKWWYDKGECAVEDGKVYI